MEKGRYQWVNKKKNWKEIGLNIYHWFPQGQFIPFSIQFCVLEGWLVWTTLGSYICLDLANRKQVRERAAAFRGASGWLPPFSEGLWKHQLWLASVSLPFITLGPRGGQEMTPSSMFPYHYPFYFLCPNFCSPISLFSIHLCLQEPREIMQEDWDQTRKSLTFT